MEHTKKSATGWIIGLILLAAALIIVSMIAPKTAARPEMINEQQQAAQQSDELDAINADIESGLETDLETEGL